MNEESGRLTSASEPPVAAVKRRSGISIVWLIPLVAAAIGLFLAYKAYSEKGPTVTVSFDTAEGLEAGKTKLRYLDVEVGTVTDVVIAPDLKHIIVTAEMVPNAADFLRSGTTFWIVKPRIGVGGVSGLGTLLSGAYIGLAPGEGEAAREFTGLDEPPPISSNVPGREFVLTASSLGSISPGAPIYYRGIDIGQVLGYKLNADASGLDLTIFVEEPFHELVRTTSRFWNASGIDLTTGAAGIELHIAPLQALLIGGIEVDTPASAQIAEAAAVGTRFPLYPNRSALAEAQFTQKTPYLIYFDGSVRGLNVGAPVEFRGITVGRVTSIAVQADPDTGRILIPVTIDIEPQRLVPDLTAEQLAASRHRAMAALVQRGLRAQLQMGNLLTGELFVDMTFPPGTVPAELDPSMPIPIIPSVPATLEALQASATAIMNKIAALPLDELMASLARTAEGVERVVNSPDLQQAASGIGPAIVELRQIVAKLDAGTGPLLANVSDAAQSAAVTLREAQGAIATIQRTVGSGSALTTDAENLMQELTRAARSIRVFADYLDRHPEALIRGRAGGAGR